MKTLFVTIVAALALSGCTQFLDKGLSTFEDLSQRAEKYGDKAYAEAGQSLDWYCKNIGQEKRLNAREKIAAASSDGNRLVAECAVDAE